MNGSFQNLTFPQNNFLIRVKVKVEVKVKVQAPSRYRMSREVYTCLLPETIKQFDCSVFDSPIFKITFSPKQLFNSGQGQGEGQFWKIEIY